MEFAECERILFDYMRQKTSFYMDTRNSDKKEFHVNNWNTKLSIVKDGSNIVIESDTFVHPAIYFYFGENFTIADINLENIVKELKSQGISLNPKNEFAEYLYSTQKAGNKSTLKSEDHIKWRKKNFVSPYAEIFVVSDYKKIVIENQFSQVTKNPIPKRNIFLAKTLVEKWISDLKEYIDTKIMEGKKIMPHITGGLDSRFLTYFWRDKDVSGVYCRTHKRWTFHSYDGDIGKQVIDKIKPNISIFEEKFIKETERLDLDGKHSNPFRESGNLNKSMYINDFVNIFDTERMLDSCNLFAFLNNDLLSISTQMTPNLLHTILLKKYCSDLLDIPFHSRIYQDKPYSFNELPVDEADKVLRAWESLSA